MTLPTYGQTYYAAHRDRWQQGGRYHKGSTATHTARVPLQSPCAYITAHTRVRSYLGAASTHVCACGAQAEQWSVDPSSPRLQSGWRVRTGRPSTLCYWSPLIWDYAPLCRPCHRVRDAAARDL